jgi:hypothetical protein
MCDYNLTEIWKLLVALVYFETKPTEEQIKKEKGIVCGDDDITRKNDCEIIQ